MAIKEEFKTIREELLINYKDVFSAKLTADQRIKCKPVKLELVKNTDELPKSNRATARRCSYNLKSADELIEDLLRSGIIERVIHHTDFTSAGSFIPKK